MAIDNQVIITSTKQFIIDNFYFGSMEKEIKDEDSFLSNGIIDSTGILELIKFLEEEYEISIDDSELLPENLDSLVNIANFVQKKNA